MNHKFRSLVLAGLVVGGIVLAAPAGAATVTFSDFSDAVSGPPDLFKISTTAPDGGNPNILVIGLEDFKAGGSVIVAFDTLSLSITAPNGYRITSVIYAETGDGDSTGGGTAIATGSITANGMTNSLASIVFSSGAVGPWGLGTSFDFSGGLVEEVTVTISNALFAVDGADIEKTMASLEVTITLIPLPASVVLLSTALIGLAMIRRDRDPSRAA